MAGEAPVLLKRAAIRRFVRRRHPQQRPVRLSARSAVAWRQTKPILGEKALGSMMDQGVSMMWNRRGPGRCAKQTQFRCRQMVGTAYPAATSPTSGAEQTQFRRFWPENAGSDDRQSQSWSRRGPPSGARLAPPGQEPACQTKPIRHLQISPLRPSASGRDDTRAVRKPGGRRAKQSQFPGGPRKRRTSV
jgi:hypothetical protein